MADSAIFYNKSNLTLIVKFDFKSNLKFILDLTFNKV